MLAIHASRYVVAMDSVPQSDGSVRDEKRYTITQLLAPAPSNAKLALSDEASERYLTVGLSLAPAQQNGLTMNGRKVNLCPHMSKACRAICLNGTGRARIHHTTRRARVAKSRLFVLDREAFMAMLTTELERFRRKAQREGKTLLVRLNVFSDVRWEQVAPELFTRFHDVQFYDYTKVASRIGNVPSNYHLTFSRSEVNHDTALAMLAAGVNVAVVFEDHSFPMTWNGYDVIDGTVSDLRVMDPRGPRGVVVALAEKDTEMHGPKYTGKRNSAIKTAGFVLPTVTSNAHGQALVTA